MAGGRPFGVHTSAYVGCRPRPPTAARAVAMRVGIDAMRLLAECGQFPYANRRGQRYMQEVRFRFHNVCGMRSDRPAAREACLRAGGDVCDVLVLAETNCLGGEQVERQWSRAWLNGYEALWARASGHPRSCCARYGCRCVCFRAARLRNPTHRTPGTQQQNLIRNQVRY